MTKVRLISLIWIVFHVCLVTGLTKDEFVIQKRKLVNIFCERNDTAMEEEEGKCNADYPPKVQEVTDKCHSVAVPDYEKGHGSFIKALCKSNEASKVKYIDCFNSEIDDDFLKQLEESQEVEDCRRSVWERHGVQLELIDNKA